VSLNEAVVPSQKRVAELVTLDDALIVGDTPDIAFDGRRRVVAQLKIFQHSLA
jgi:hypothetical protein